nr:cadherin-related family member 4 isoform X2 [Geotrypetes seraphini]XP_033782328.1 cadherin-related family member 4 isoform X2 [Geotrypetes seraphini]
MEEATSLLFPLLILLTVIQSSSGQAYLDDLPMTDVIDENTPPKTPLYTFYLRRCTDPNPKARIDHSNPPTNFFNDPIVNEYSDLNSYKIQITASSAAAFDSDDVNLYQLFIKVDCSGRLLEGQLFLQVQPSEEPQCEAKFASIGETVQVREDVAPFTELYKVVLRRPSYSTLTYKITQPSPEIFSIDNGKVQVPASGFNYKSGNNKFTLQITVENAKGKSCSGTLTIEVLPVYHNTVKFTSVSNTVVINENQFPAINVTRVKASGDHVLYELISPTTAYYIDQELGTIRTSRILDLEKNPELKQSILLIRAYNKYHHNDSDIITVNITVQDVNEMPPKCSPAVFVTEVPETTPIETVLSRFSCFDPDVSNTIINFQLMSPASSRYKFRMQNSALQVNSTLTYDSEEMARNNFQYTANILVTDNGIPPLTTVIPVLVKVTRVNQYYPQCNPGTQIFAVNENTPLLSFIGQVNATDRDYADIKSNNVEFSIVDGHSPRVFFIAPISGAIHLLSPLDREVRAQYKLTIQVADVNNDIKPDPINQKTITCIAIINVQDFNDNPPECKPPHYETTICSTLMMTSPIFENIPCSDKDDNNRFSYAIVGGNINNRFRIRNGALYHSGFSYNLQDVYDPLTFELLIEVTDDPPPRLSTTVAVIVRVIPCPTTILTTTQKTTTQKREPQIVTLTEFYWAPDPWFVTVMTITGILLLAALAFLIWKILSRTTYCMTTPKEASQPLLQNKNVPDIEAHVAKEQQPNMNQKEPIPLSPLSLQFDGRAQDPVSGRDYLFNSRTGERRWI